jgi:hypothetical protein
MHDLQIKNPTMRREFKNIMRRAEEISQRDADEQYDIGVGQERGAQIRNLKITVLGEDEA